MLSLNFGRTVLECLMGTQGWGVRAGPQRCDKSPTPYIVYVRCCDPNR